MDKHVQLGIDLAELFGLHGLYCLVPALEEHKFITNLLASFKRKPAKSVVYFVSYSRFILNVLNFLCRERNAITDNEYIWILSV